MATNIFVYWSDGLGHMTIIVGTGVQGICQQKMPARPGISPIFSNAWGLPGAWGMLAAGIDLHITKQVFLVCKCLGDGTVKFPNPRPPGLIVHQMPGFAGGMLAAGIDSHIIPMDEKFILGRRLLLSFLSNAAFIRGRRLIE